MWKLIIADDEAVIRKGLKILTDWEQMDIEIIGEASDGKQLYSLIEEKKPDLVLTDIRMPDMSGLDVIQKCAEMDNPPRFIFISGYEEFSYAKDAVRFGAVDYLLKPVAEEDLQNAMKKAIGQLLDKQKVSIFKEDKSELQQVFQKMNDGYEYAEEELYQRFAKADLPVEDSFYVGVCFSMIEDSKLKESVSYEQRGLLRFSVYNRIVEEFKQRRLGFLIKKEEYLCDTMAVIPKAHENDYIEELLMPIWEKIQRDLNVKLCMGIGSPVEKISLWKSAHKSAKFACELYYFEEKPVINLAEINREYTVSFEDFNQLIEETFRQIAARSDQAIDTIDQALAAVEEIHYGNRYAAINRVLIFTGSLLEKLFAVHLVGGDFSSYQNELQEQIRYIPTYRQVKEWMLDYYRKLLDKIYEDNSHKASGEMVKVQQYIKEHYRDDLSLKELAEVACVSPTYFSALFKKETGENYKSYVTGIRMEEAIKLVMNTDLKTYEIAEEVGYHNVRRFVDAFKSIYKISPMDYKKINRKK